VIVTSQAGGSADVAVFTADVPLLCVPAFRRVCSEQLVIDCFNVGAAPLDFSSTFTSVNAINAERAPRTGINEDSLSALRFYLQRAGRAEHRINTF
jgi:hypothetical protein